MERVIRAILLGGLECLGRYYSSYRGIVMDLADPDNLGRIKVVVPKVSGSGIHPAWAYPKGLPMGNTKGISWPVKIGDMVWIEFEYGDPEKPIWSHGHYVTGEKPSEFTNDTYGMLTPGGHKILINDKDETLTISKKDGLVISVDKDNKIKISNNDADLCTELINLITACRQMIVTTPSGPSSAPPVNDAQFAAVDTNIKKLLKQ